MKSLLLVMSKIYTCQFAHFRKKVQNGQLQEINKECHHPIAFFHHHIA